MLLWRNMDLGLFKTKQQKIATYGKDFYTTTNYIEEVEILMLTPSFNFNQISKNQSYR